jgi:hypothetical protein
MRIILFTQSGRARAPGSDRRPPLSRGARLHFNHSGQRVSECLAQPGKASGPKGVKLDAKSQEGVLWRRNAQAGARDPAGSS